jgi:SET domain-containing protein
MAIALETHKPRIDLKSCRFPLRLARSAIHRWGVHAKTDIPAGRPVIEYTGERINHLEANRRSAGPLTYLFTLNNCRFVDGAVGGSGAEFINHSCEPNLEARILRGRVFYYSLRDIPAGEELTVDYNFDDTDEKVMCSCGARRCRGTINVK